MAVYLSSSALKESKASSLVGGKAPLADDENYFAYHYGTIKKRVWRNQVENCLDGLAITKHFPAKSVIPLASRSGEYKQAIKTWRPPRELYQAILG